jgi:hypothetical protein
VVVAEWRECVFLRLEYLPPDDDRTGQTVTLRLQAEMCDVVGEGGHRVGLLVI